MDRPESILDAALAVYSETGSTAIDGVRRRSGASVGSIYHHFGGKEGIAQALYLEIMRGYQEGFLRALGRAGGAEEGIKALVRHHLRWVERHPAEASFLLQGRGGGDELKELNRALFGEVAAWIDGQRELRPMSRDAFYVVVIGPAQEASRHWLAGRMTSLRKVEAELTEAAWRAVRKERM